MRRALAVLLVVAIATVVAVGAFGKGKKPHDSIAIASLGGGQVTFAVHLDAPLAPNAAYSIWVANICSDAASVVVTAAYLPVVWGTNTDPQPVDGTAGPFATDGTNPDAGPIVSCTGYAALWPDVWTPLDAASTITYTP